MLIPDAYGCPSCDIAKAPCGGRRRRRPDGASSIQLKRLNRRYLWKSGVVRDAGTAYTPRAFTLGTRGITLSRFRLLAAISLIVALAVALVAVLVLQRARDSTTRVAGSAASGPAQPVTTPPPEPVPVPTPDNTGRDFDHIWREIQRFADWTYAHPEVGLRYIHLVYHPECFCYADLKDDLSLLIRDGVHFEDAATRIESLVVTSDLGEAVRIESRMSIAPQRVVNSEGATVQSGEGVPARTFAANLELQNDGRWLARSIDIIESS